MHAPDLTTALHATKLSALPRSAVLGGLVWLALAAFSIPNLHMWRLIEVVFLLAPLVLVPLGMKLISRLDGEDALLRGAVLFQPVAALLTVLSFGFEQGLLACALSAPWALVCGLLSFSGLRRFWRKGFRPLDSAVLRSGLVLIAAGGMGLVQSRLGLTPLGFVEPLVLLVAVHYHFTAFVGPVFTAKLGQQLKVSHASRWMRGLFQAAAPCVVIGTPIVALGFIFWPPLKVAGSVLLAFGLASVAALTMALLPALKGRVARALLALASACVLAAMALAMIFSIGEYRENLILSIPQMAWSHGLLNGLGFSLGGLLGWALVQREP